MSLLGFVCFLNFCLYQVTKGSFDQGAKGVYWNWVLTALRKSTPERAEHVCVQGVLNPQVINDTGSLPRLVVLQQTKTALRLQTITILGVEKLSDWEHRQLQHHNNIQ